MNKRYISGTCLSINLQIGGEGYRHIVFDPQHESGSSFISEDAEEQAYLESHPYFGEFFELDPYWQDQSSGVEEEEAEEATALQELSFSNESDAKEYLAETFGVSRTKLKTRKAIESVATEQGITIRWESVTASEGE